MPSESSSTCYSYVPGIVSIESGKAFEDHSGGPFYRHGTCAQEMEIARHILAVFTDQSDIALSDREVHARCAAWYSAGRLRMEPHDTNNPFCGDFHTLRNLSCIPERDLEWIDYFYGVATYRDCNGDRLYDCVFSDCETF